APPCTRRSSPSPASRSRSRRTVIAEQSNSCARSSTDTRPRSRSPRRINSCRFALSTCSFKHHFCANVHEGASGRGSGRTWTRGVAPNAGLVVWSRLGSALPRDAVPDAVEEQRLIDLHGMLRPPEDLALYRAELAAWPGPDAWPQQVEWLEVNDGFRHDLLTE